MCVTSRHAYKALNKGFTVLPSVPDVTYTTLSGDEYDQRAMNMTRFACASDATGTRARVYKELSTAEREAAHTPRGRVRVKRTHRWERCKVGRRR